METKTNIGVLLQEKKNSDWRSLFPTTWTIKIKQRFGDMSLIMTKDKLETKEKVFVPPPEQLKETKVRQFVFHNDKGQVEAKIEGPIKKL